MVIVDQSMCDKSPLFTESEVQSMAELSNMFSFPSHSQNHKSHVEEPPHSRPLSDRKRKFVDTELAQDTEGTSVMPMTVSPYPYENYML